MSYLLADAKVFLDAPTYQALILLSHFRFATNIFQSNSYIVSRVQSLFIFTTRRYSKSCFSLSSGSGYTVPVFLELQIVLMEYRSPLRERASTLVVPAGAGMRLGCPGVLLK